VLPLGADRSEAVRAAAEALYEQLSVAGLDVLLDDRKGVRPGAMFADQELIGIPHRVVVSERGLAAGQIEYRDRRKTENELIAREAVVDLLVYQIKTLGWDTYVSPKGEL
jgi:prolyl-tRNA synthetase